MSPNLLTAIKGIADFKNNDLKDYFAAYPIRVNQVGEQLEYYVRDAICGSFKSAKDALTHSRGTFSYLGSQNYGPDIIVTNGDAFEIKKIQTLKATLALNNSYPKDVLHRDDHTINNECRKVDGGKWTSKEIFYIVGVTKENRVKHLYFVHGRCYAADRSIYENISNKVKRGIDKVCTDENLHMTKTKELGRINNMDPLRITNFRMRGMWEIENPVAVFSYRYEVDEKKSFSLVALMTKEKYDSFPQEDRNALKANKEIQSKAVNIKNPNNPAQLMQAQLLTIAW
jgi:hypothetical protein